MKPTLINLAVSGSSSSDTAASITRGRVPPADYYLVMTGLHDARLYGTSSAQLKTYHENLTEIFRVLTSESPGQVISVAQPRPERYDLYPPHDRGSDEAIEAYNSELESAASESVVYMVSLPRWLPSTMLSPDTVHPSDLGHKEISKAVMASINSP